MSALGSADLQGRERESLTSHSDQPTETSVFPPFTRELSVDEQLKLSQENFNETIFDIFRDKDTTSLSQLRATRPFPTPYVLAQFAYKTFTDYKKRETDAQYEKRLALPDGWKLLTTAHNSRMKNGYFGAAYWHPEFQQVVIAHRGTTPQIFGALWTDLTGVMHNQYVPQMESASTFADKVVEVLQEVNDREGGSFQLFFTGYSLGGWLAQITTFTTEYLKREGNVFLKNSGITHCHPHTVVFESPGCKMMLSQMKDTFDVRLDGRSITLKPLDITTYLSAPNRINTCNKHVGTVYRIFTDLSDMGWLAKHTFLYNLATASLHKIVEAFDPQTGQVREDEQGRLKILLVVDWPYTAGYFRSKEYNSFFKWAVHLNNYHPEVRDATLQLMGYHPIRYQTKMYDERVCRLNIFSHEQFQFLQDYHRLRQSPERFRPKELFSLMEDNQAQEEAVYKLQSFEIENDRVFCPEARALQELIPYVKRLLQLFPGIKESTKNALSSDETRYDVYQLQARSNLEQFNQSTLKFKPDDLSLTEFLRSDQLQVLQVQMIDGEERTGLNKVLQQMSCLNEVQYNILTFNPSLTVKEWLSLSAFMLSIAKPYILLMAFEASQLFNDDTEDILKTMFRTIKDKPFIKFILTTPSLGYRFQLIGREVFGNGFVTRNGE